MKKTSVFFFLMLLLTASVLILDWLKATYFLHRFHSMFIIFKTLFFPITGIIIMKYSVNDRPFKMFLFVYLLLWAGYFLLKAGIFAGDHFHLFNVNATDQFGYQVAYLSFTKLISPIPFIFFWMIDRIFFVEQKKQSE